MPAYWWWRTGAPELHHSCHRSTPGVLREQHQLKPTQRCPQLLCIFLHCFLGYSTELWTQSSATMIQLPQSSVIHSPVKHLQLLALPGCEFPTKQEGDVSASPLPQLCVLALVLQSAENPTGRKYSSLSLSQLHSSFSKQGISSFYFSLSPSPGPAGCCFRLNTPK